MGIDFSVVAQGHEPLASEDSLHHDQSDLHIEDWSTIPEVWLDDAVPRLSARERSDMLRHKIIPYCWLPQCTVFGVATEAAIREGRRRNLTLVGTVRPEVYRRVVRKHLSQKLLSRAVHGLRQAKPWASAETRLSAAQMTALGFALMTAGLLIAFQQISFVTGAVQLAAGLFFLMVVFLRCVCLMPLPKGPGMVAPLLAAEDLPAYTILVPLFRETNVVSKLIHALSNLNYPRDKLDIKIILEEQDRPMHAAIKAMDLPSYYDVIIVPRGKPQTKPRALNYAVQFARGSLVTIYDGEDIPDPNQLILAAAQFSRAGEDMACLQAALDFFNPSENWITRHFTTEYAALFRVVLPALAAYGLPLPLGGTSNHFRLSALDAVGYWDAFNVTEDADLGIRLARHGYKTGILHSTTLEEANPVFGNWMKQRRRWLKGFLQTWLVHNRNPLRLLRETGFTGFMAIQAMTLGVFASALLHPVLLVVALWNFLPENLARMTASYTGSAMSGLSLAVLLAGYVSAIATSEKGLKRIGAFGWTSVLATIPIYWMLISVAAWMALWDFIVAPFHWHKTQHGLTRHTGNKPLRPN
jgi:glycosyltransferase XagB